MTGWKRRLATCILTAAMLAPPMLARAQDEDDDAGAARASWRAVMMIWLKKNPEMAAFGFASDDRLRSFARVMACDLFMQFRDDETKWPEKSQLIKQVFQLQQPPPLLRIVTKSELGNYDEASQSFDFQGLSRASFPYKRPDKEFYGVFQKTCDVGQAAAKVALTDWDDRLKSPFPYKFSVVPLNGGEFQRIPMPKDKVDLFLFSRRDKRGEINREIRLIIDMDIQEFENFRGDEARPQDDLSLAVAKGIVRRITVIDPLEPRKKERVLMTYEPPPG